jgi:hypothetical protein
VHWKRIRQQQPARKAKAVDAAAVAEGVDAIVRDVKVARHATLQRATPRRV